MHFGRDELSLVLGLDGFLYAIGGFGGPSNTCLKEVERYSLEGGFWEMIPPLKVGRRALTAVTLPHGVYVLGGFDGENYLSSVERLDPETMEWTTVKGMKRARCTAAAVASADHQFIYIIGGFDNGPLDNLEK